MCVEAVDLMYQAAGGSSVYATNPLDRLFRDAHTVHQHITNSPKVFEMAGQMLLGVEPACPAGEQTSRRSRKADEAAER